MKKIIVFMALISMKISCIPNENVVSHLSENNYGDSTEIVNISGLYTFLDNYNNTKSGINAHHQNIIFYPDQTVCYFFIEEDSLENNDIQMTPERCIFKWGKKKSKWGHKWGVYVKRGNYIFTDMYDKSLMFYMSWNYTKDVFLLNNDTLFHKHRKGFTLKGEKMFDMDYDDTYRFIQTESLPHPLQSNHFLKKKKWIWRNPNDWAKYMESYKRQK